MQNLRFINPALRRPVTRIRFPLRSLGYSTSYPRSVRHLNRPEFTRTYHVDPLNHSAENHPTRALIEIYDSATHAASHVEPPGTEAEESCRTALNQTARPIGWSLSLQSAVDKTEKGIGAKYAPVGNIIGQPKSFINRLENGGVLILEKNTLRLGEQHFRCGLVCHISDSDVIISVAGEALSKVFACYAHSTENYQLLIGYN